MHSSYFLFTQSFNGLFIERSNGCKMGISPLRTKITLIFLSFKNFNISNELCMLALSHINKVLDKSVPLKYGIYIFLSSL